MDKTVKERTISFIKYKGMKMKTFEEKCGLSSGYVTSMRNGFGSEKLRNVLTAYPELNREWLLYGEGEMLNDESKNVKTNDEGLPLIPFNAMAGLLTGQGCSVMPYECERYIVPALQDADFMIRVKGDSMLPMYMPGDLIACKIVKANRLWFQWGKVYVVSTTQGVLVKRVEPSSAEGYVKLVSENERYKPFDYPAEEIDGLALVTGLIRIQ